MLLSYNWLREFVNINLSFEELDNTLTMLGIEVEKADFQAKKYNNFIVAEVLEKEKHSNADKLSVCQINTGTEVLQVICGAPNVAKGQKVILGLSGAVVPNGGFQLEKRKIRGVESNGMLCSLAELDLGQSADGIEVLPSDSVPGTPISKFLGLDDVILEIGLTPNKSDCLSHLGIAREIAACLRIPITYPSKELTESSDSVINFAKVRVEDINNCPRYTARVIRNCKIGESPAWLKRKLENVGLRPINSAVDITNYILMESGQPLHAFDLDKISGKEIIVKSATDGNKFTTLDGKERTLTSDMLMICDAEQPIAIGGVMGGQNSEISMETVNVLIESAFFDPSSVRKTSKKLSLQSHSSYRFERGVDISNVPLALDRAAKLIAEICGGEIANGMIDIYPGPRAKKEIKLRYSRVEKIIGVKLTNELIDDILQALQFEILEKKTDFCLLQVPHHRVDVELEIDLIEEIARLYNYDNIENVFTSEINFSLTDVSSELRVPKLRNRIRAWFVDNGFNEILTPNQTDPRSAALFTDTPIKLANPLGEELSIMRASMIPSFMNVISKNLRNGNYNLRLFEIGKVFANEKAKKQFIEGISEKEYLTIALSGLRNPKQWGLINNETDFFDLKGILQSLFKFLNIGNISFASNADHNAFDSNSMIIKLDNIEIGIVGSVKDNISKLYDIEHTIFIASLALANLYSANQNQKSKSYRAVSPYPRVYRDLAFILDKNIAADTVRNIIIKSAGNLANDVVLFDLYEGKNMDSNLKSLAFSLEFVSFAKTLTDIEIEKSINNIIKNVEENTGAKLRK